MWRNPEYLTPNPSLQPQEQIFFCQNPWKEQPRTPQIWTNRATKPGQKPPRSAKTRRKKRAGGTDLSIDEDLFHPLSPLRIDRLEQARERRRRRRRPATTGAMSATTTRSEMGQEGIYESWLLVLSSPPTPAPSVVVASVPASLNTRLNPDPKRRQEQKGQATPLVRRYLIIPHSSPSCTARPLRRTTRDLSRHARVRDPAPHTAETARSSSGPTRHWRIICLTERGRRGRPRCAGAGRTIGSAKAVCYAHSDDSWTQGCRWPPQSEYGTCWFPGEELLCTLLRLSRGANVFGPHLSSRQGRNASGGGGAFLVGFMRCEWATRGRDGHGNDKPSATRVQGMLCCFVDSWDPQK
uniref:Uncharacterized protein n=1 Tax=Zea mays TaxID=4577 RepID=A0A804QK21_MAIZE